MYKISDLPTLLAEKIRFSSPDGCWRWTAYKNKGGYGRFRWKCEDGKHRGVVAHRLVYHLLKDSMLTVYTGKCGVVQRSNRMLRHQCGHTDCCNPEHFLVGTNRQNTVEGKSSALNPNKTSSYVGVCWYKKRDMWQSQITIAGKRNHLGYFDNEIDAARAYQDALSEI